MPQSSSEAFEDGLDLQIGLLEAYVPSTRADWPGYPFPMLRASGEQEMRTFRTIILENPYLRLTLLPGMGGRVISLFDKRTGVEILRRHPMIEPQDGGPRGAYVREGLQISLDGHERLNALGNVSTHFEHPEDEDSDATVWIGETCTGSGLSFHLRISLPPDRAELRLEARVFNRWLISQEYDGGLSIYLGDGNFDGTSFYSTDRDCGLALFSGGQPFDGGSFYDGVLTFCRLAHPNNLAPRQVDSWSVSLVPLSGLGNCLGASLAGAANVADSTLKVQVSEQRLGHKLLMLTEDGQTLEAVVDLYPENVMEIPLGSLKPVEVVLRDPGKQEVLRVGSRLQVHQVPPSDVRTILNTVSIGTESSERDLQRATFDVSSRHLAHTLLGLRALSEKRFGDAGSAFEQALGFNAEDPLLWWGKAMASRLDDVDNQAELLNAHYLAPLEPALRAESFLAQPVSLDPEPNRLLVALEENPEEFIEVACLLIEAGLFDQASRWIDEAMRHRDLPMLRYLMAFCLLVATKLSTEAYDHVRIAGKSPVAPPFPYRSVERKAIDALRQAFPDDRNLQIFSELLNG